MPTAREQRVEIALSATLCVLAVSAYGASLGRWSHLVVATVAAVLPALLVAAIASRGWSPPGSAAALALALPLCGGAVLLTALDLPFALIWLSSGAAALLAVRTRGPVAPVGPPLVALWAAVVLTGDRFPLRLPLLAAFAVVALALVTLRANRLVGMVLSLALAPVEEPARPPLTAVGTAAGGCEPAEPAAPVTALPAALVAAEPAGDDAGDREVDAPVRLWAAVSGAR